MSGSNVCYVFLWNNLLFIWWLPLVESGSQTSIVPLLLLDSYFNITWFSATRFETNYFPGSSRNIGTYHIFSYITHSCILIILWNMRLFVYKIMLPRWNRIIWCYSYFSPNVIRYRLSLYLISCAFLIFLKKVHSNTVFRRCTQDWCQVPAERGFDGVMLILPVEDQKW